VANDIVFGADYPRSTVSSRLARGELARLTAGVYTTSVEQRLEDVVRGAWPEILGRLVPDGVVTDRSARAGGPVEGVLYLSHPRRPRDVTLPGLEVRARRGAPPQPGDIELPGGLHLAGRARGLAENCLPSRARSGHQRRTLDAAELGDWVDYLCQNEGAKRLTEYRREAERLAPVLGVSAEHLRTLQSLVGIALGSRPHERTASDALAARRGGFPVDQHRVRLFELLADALRHSSPQTRPLAADGKRYRYLPFFEAYFSNFIEGTEFDVDEAARIVFDEEIPANRPADAHDVIGTYRLLNDSIEMSRTGEDSDKFIELLRHRNRLIMEGRPENHPGVFKSIANRAGGTYFVSPELVEGTLAAGFRLRDGLDTAWERAVYMAFVVAEVHPFDDANGRTARAVMNAELTAGGQCRLIIPTVFRDDYLDGLRGLSRRDDASVYIKAMRYAHSFTASVDFSDYESAKDQLAQANAFEEPNSPDRLRILDRAIPDVDVGSEASRQSASASDRLLTDSTWRPGPEQSRGLGR
jgi:hypothetical protein